MRGGVPLSHRGSERGEEEEPWKEKGPERGREKRGPGKGRDAGKKGPGSGKCVRGKHVRGAAERLRPGEKAEPDENGCGQCGRMEQHQSGWGSNVRRGRKRSGEAEQTGFSRNRRGLARKGPRCGEDRSGTEGPGERLSEGGKPEQSGSGEDGTRMEWGRERSGPGQKRAEQDGAGRNAGKKGPGSGKRVRGKHIRGAARAERLRSGSSTSGERRAGRAAPGCCAGRASEMWGSEQAGIPEDACLPGD